MSLITRADRGLVARDAPEVFLRARRIGYAKSFDDSSLRDRLMLLNWLMVTTRLWEAAVHLKSWKDSSLSCAGLKMSCLETLCVTPRSVEVTEGYSAPSVTVDSLEVLYGRIDAKLKYIQSLEKSRAKILHRLGSTISDKFPEISNCKHIQSLFVGGTLNSVPEPSSSAQATLKDLCADVGMRRRNEVEFLDWAGSAYSENDRGKASSKTKRSPKIELSGSTSSDPKEVDKSWDDLQRELRHLQDSEMMGELEEAVSYYMNVCGWLDVRTARKVAAATSTKIEKIIQLLSSEDREEVESRDSSILSRLRTVHKRYQKEVACLLFNSLDYRNLQQRIPVRYAGTGPALKDIRARHHTVLSRTAAACEEVCPFEFKFVSPGRSEHDEPHVANKNSCPGKSST